MKKTIKDYILIFQAVLLVTITLFNFKFNPVDAIKSIIYLLVTAFVILYGLFLYKKPHGNILKYAMLLFSFYLIYATAIEIYSYPNVHLYIRMLALFAAAIICYVAGRLDRVKQNKYLFLISEILLFIVFFDRILINVGKAKFLISAIRYSRNIVLLTTLIIAYFARYKEHKEAGLKDR